MPPAEEGEGADKLGQARRSGTWRVARRACRVLDGSNATVASHLKPSTGAALGCVKCRTWMWLMGVEMAGRE